MRHKSTPMNRKRERWLGVQKLDVLHRPFARNEINQDQVAEKAVRMPGDQNDVLVFAQILDKASSQGR